jgi:catechol 2,3-dioxygenase-like lactoylglutathione lyase family enzyme
MLDQPTTAGGSPAGEHTASRLAISQVFAKLPAQDVERARGFYRETFGLEPYSEHNRHLHYEIDGGYFIIFPSSGAASGTHDQLGFLVDDIDAAAAQLRSRGITFEDYETPPHVTKRNGITDFGAVRAAWLKDSEGNLISIGQFTNGTPFNRSAAQPG